MLSARLANLIGALGIALADGQERIGADAIGLAPSDAAALNAVGQAPGCSVEAVRAALGVSHPGAVRTIDRLESRGLVERGHGADGRTRGLLLTATGQEAWNDLNTARLVWLQSALGSLERSQRNTLVPMVETLLAALTTGADEAEHLCRLCDERVCPQARCPVTIAADAAT